MFEFLWGASPRGHVLALNCVRKVDIIWLGNIKDPRVNESSLRVPFSSTFEVVPLAETCEALIFGSTILSCFTFRYYMMRSSRF